MLQLCEGGTVTDMARGIIASDKKMQEEHIAFILREVIKVSFFLQNIIYVLRTICDETIRRINQTLRLALFITSIYFISLDSHKYPPPLPPNPKYRFF